MADRRRSIGLFLAWTVAGVCLVLMVSQIGVFTVPLGFLLVAVLVRRSNARHALGLLAGAGLVGVLVGLINLDYQPCGNAQANLPSGVDCGGFDGAPWLVAGLATTVAAVLAFWGLRRS